MKLKIGQSGVEYLSVYAIAFMILLVVLAGVYYMWNAGTTTTPYCEFPLDFSCSDFYMKENGSLILVLRQTTGRTINITGFNCTAQENSVGATTPLPFGVIINDGEQQVIANDTPCYRASGNIASGNIKGFYTGKLYINYTETDTFMGHMLVGRIVARYE